MIFTAHNFVLLPAGGKWKIASEEQLIKLVTGETDEPIKTPPSAAPDRYTQMRERENIIFKFNIKD
jgi:hypothetical protein